MNATAAVLRELISITLEAHQLELCMLLIFPYLNKIKNRAYRIVAEVDADAAASVTERAQIFFLERGRKISPTLLLL